jgi:hypothetical protein
MTKAVVAYLRVSTARQSRRGLGLEAQRQAVEAFAAAQGFTIASSSRSRPIRQDALDRRPCSPWRCRRRGSSARALDVVKNPGQNHN